MPRAPGFALGGDPGLVVAVTAAVADPAAVATGQARCPERAEPPESPEAAAEEASTSSDGLDELWSGGATDYRSSRGDDDEWDRALMVPGTPTLREHLLQQPGCLRLSDRDRVLVQAVIEAVDTSGYLTQPLDELCPLCPLHPAPDADELQIALRHVQALDPPGVAARTVAECLKLQLLALDLDEHPARELAIRIVDRHLDLLAAHDFQRLQRELACEESALQAATVLLRGLTPRPGAGYGADETQFVVADVIVQQQKGTWTASINPEVIPRIRVSRFDASILEGGREGGGSPVSQHLREARWPVPLSPTSSTLTTVGATRAIGS